MKVTCKGPCKRQFTQKQMVKHDLARASYDCRPAAQTATYSIKGSTAVRLI